MKKITACLVIIFLTSPLAVLAADFGFSFGTGSGGTGFSIGFGSGSGSGTAWDPGLLSTTGLPSGSIIGIIEGIMFWLLAVLGLVGVIGFIISGILYLISTGDEDMINRAKRAMTWSIVGVIVGLAGVVVIQAINLALSSYSNF